MIERLEAEALALRGRGDAVAEREATAVAALEALRLDLLRLRADPARGALTRELAEAGRIGERIDARLAAADERTPAPNA